MLRKLLSLLKPYLVAIFCVASALLLTAVFDLYIKMEFSPFLFFFGAVIASAWYGGFGPGLLANALSGAIAAYFFVSPAYSLNIGWGETVRLSLFMLEGFLIVAIIAAFHSSRQRLEINLLKLKASEERYRCIVDTAYEGIWSIDANLRTKYVNQRMAEMLGYRIEEMLDRSIFDFMDREARLEAAQYIERRKQGIKEQFDFRYRHKNGSDLWAIISSNPIWDESGEFAGAIAMLTDITQRKQADEALKESERKFRSVVDSQMIGIGFWQIDGTITDANEAFMEIVGYSREELNSGQICCQNLTPPEYQHLNEQAIAQIQTIGFFTPFEKEFLCRDGSRVPILIGGCTFNENKDKGPFFVLNISDRKRAEEISRQLAYQVQEKANTLNAILSASVDHIYIIDRAGKYKYVSDEGAAILGFKPNDLIDKTWQELGLSADIMIPFDEQRKTVWFSGKPIKGETNFLTNNNDIKYYEYIISPLYNSNKTLEGTIVVSRENTERKLAEEALEISNKRFRRLVESNIFGVAFGDFQGRIHYANDYFLKMVGYDREDLENEKIRWDKMTPPEFLHLDSKGEEELKQHGVANPFEKEYTRKDGSRVPILIGGALLQEPYEEQQEIICFYLDLTERKRAQKALQETNQTLQALIRACPLAIAVFSLDDGKVKMWNPASEKIFGWSEQEALGKFMPSVTEEKQQEFWTHLEFIRQEKSLISVETKRQKKDGSTIDISLWATPISDAKGNVNCMSIVADISDRKHLEEERDRLLCGEQAARTQAETANRLKDEFLATLSHELRTPLNAMLGWSHLLHSRKLDEATTTRAVESIYRNTKSLTQLIDDVLDVSRIITGKLRVELLPIELKPAIEAAIDTILPAAEAKKIHIETRLDSSAGSVLGDATRLQQIVWNLLSNAIKFTPNGGKVEISLSVEESAGEWDITRELPITNYQFPISQYAQIKVTDTGIGISANFLPYVFDRFTQADSTMTRTHGGLGLGLAILRHLVEIHGGTVSAQSPGIGKGATFIVNLPILEVSQVAGVLTS